MMDTYSQIYIQVVFAVQSRKALIHREWEERLYQYISAIVKNKGQKLIAINGMPDHLHLFIGLKPSCCLSDLVREIKKSSSAFIKDNRLCQHKFNWQSGFGAFSYSKSQVHLVANYVMNQKQHHSKTSFKKEYLKFLDTDENEPASNYHFQWLDTDASGIRDLQHNLS